MRNLDLSIRCGEKIAVMGKSGSGKTTLAKILAGYYTVSSGDSFLDGEKINYSQLRQLVTYVPQQSYVFTGTIFMSVLIISAASTAVS